MSNTIIPFTGYSPAWASPSAYPFPSSYPYYDAPQMGGTGFGGGGGYGWPNYSAAYPPMIYPPSMPSSTYPGGLSALSYAPRGYAATASYSAIPAPSLASPYPQPNPAQYFPPWSGISQYTPAPYPPPVPIPSTSWPSLSYNYPSTNYYSSPPPAPLQGQNPFVTPYLFPPFDHFPGVGATSPSGPIPEKRFSPLGQVTSTLPKLVLPTPMPYLSPPQLFTSPASQAPNARAGDIFPPPAGSSVFRNRTFPAPKQTPVSSRWF